MVVSFYWLILQLLIKLEDNRLIETVGIPVQDEKGLMRLTACVSSQVIFQDRVQSLTKFPHCSYVLILALEFQCTVHYSNCFSYVAYFEWVKRWNRWDALCVALFVPQEKEAFQGTLKGMKLLSRYGLSFPCYIFKIHFELELFVRSLVNLICEHARLKFSSMTSLKV